MACCEDYELVATGCNDAGLKSNCLFVALCIFFPSLNQILICCDARLTIAKYTNKNQNNVTPECAHIITSISHNHSATQYSQL